MNYLPSQSFQLEGFLYSIALGFILGLIYDVLKTVFYLITFKPKKLINIRDTFFFIICFWATFIYLLVMCEGQILFYALIGEIIGFTIYWVLISRKITAPFFNTFIKKINKIEIKLKEKFKKL